MGDTFETTKQAVLGHIESLFEEMEQEMAMSHQEKYALLEDAFESASDKGELRVAFEQWHREHSDDIEFDHNADELWDNALGEVDDYDDLGGSFDDSDDYDDDLEDEDDVD